MKTKAKLLIGLGLSSGLALALVHSLPDRGIPPEIPAPAAAPSFSGRTTCEFAPGQRLAYQVHTSVTSQLDLSALLAQQSLGGHAQVTVNPAKEIRMDLTWRLNVEAKKTMDDGSTILAAQVSDLVAQLDGKQDPSTRTPESAMPFLIRLDPTCAVVAFARRENAEPRSALTQQSLAIALQWRFPKQGEETKYLADERNSLGEYHARYALSAASGQTVILRKVLKYHRFYNDGGGSGEAMRTRAGLRVEVGAGPWFDSLTLDEMTRLHQQGRTIGIIHDQTRASQLVPAETAIEAHPDQAGWVWGDLFGTGQSHEGEPLANIPGRIKAMSLGQAMAELEQLILSRPGKPNEWVDFMRDWIRAHPDRIAALLEAVRTGKLTGKFAQPAVFLALRLADLPEARRALQGVLTNPNFNTVNRMRAGLSLANSRVLPENYLESLMALSRDQGTSSDTAQMRSVSAALLGAVASEQARLNPAVAQTARADLAKQIADATTSPKIRELLNGIGNSASPELLEKVRPFMDHSDEKVRQAAATALSEMPPDKTTAFYEPWLNRESSQRVRSELVRSYWHQAFLAKQAPPESVVKASITALDGEKNRGVAEELVRLLGQASAQGNSEAQLALASRFKSEMQKPDRNLDLLEQLGRFVSPEVLR